MIILSSLIFVVFIKYNVFFWWKGRVRLCIVLSYFTFLNISCAILFGKFLLSSDKLGSIAQVAEKLKSWQSILASYCLICAWHSSALAVHYKVDVTWCTWWTWWIWRILWKLSTWWTWWTAECDKHINEGNNFCIQDCH